MSVTIPDSKVSIDFNIDELTSGTLNGNGVFDVLMKTFKAHLMQEYESNRIRNTDYANAYINLMNLAMQQASNYSLAKAKLPLELQLIEAQIHKTATDAIVATKQGGLFDAQSIHTMAETRQVDYITDNRLPAETKQINTQTDEIKFEIDKVLPKQLEQMDAQIDNQEKQTALLEYDLTQIKPKELELLGKDISLKENQIQIGLKEITLKEKQIPLMEKELELKGQQVELGKTEIILKEKQIPLMEKEIELKQNQIDLGKAELGLKEKRLDIAEKEIGIKEQQLKLAQYEFEYKAPAEVGQINSQTDLYNQKTVTEKAQTDPSVIIPNSVIDVQNKLHEKQKDSYDRDAEQKAATLLIDTWKVRHNADPDDVSNGVNNNNKLHDFSLGKAVDSLLKGIDVEV